MVERPEFRQLLVLAAGLDRDRDQYSGLRMAWQFNSPAFLASTLDIGIGSLPAYFISYFYLTVPANMSDDPRTTPKTFGGSSYDSINYALNAVCIDF